MNQRNNFAQLFVLLAFVSSCTNAEYRIIGGTKINIAQSPHTVAIFDGDSYECPGSIVGIKSVLTVAHCVEDKLEADLRVVAGVTDIKNEIGQRYDVEAIDVYNDPATEPIDIAVVKVARDFDYNEKVRRIALCEADLVPGTIMRISGWGYLFRDRGTLSPLLQGALVRIQEHEDAEETMSAETVMGDIWLGDTGAAGVIGNRLCAVAQCIMSNSPNIYINVTNARVQNFITTCIRSHSCDTTAR